MNIQKLREKFEELNHLKVFKDTKWEESAKLGIEEDIKLSVQFAIEILEEFDEHTQINEKIEELKKYLHENS